MEKILSWMKSDLFNDSDENGTKLIESFKLEIDKFRCKLKETELNFF